MSGSSHPPEGLKPLLIQKGKVRDVSDFFFFFGLLLNFSLLLLHTFLSEHLFHCLRKAASCEGEFCCVSCRWGAEMQCAGGSRLAEATFSRMPAPAPGGFSRPTSEPVAPAWGFCPCTWGRDYACWANVWEVFWSSRKEKERPPTCHTLPLRQESCRTEGRDQEKKIGNWITSPLHCSPWGPPALVALNCFPKWTSCDVRERRREGSRLPLHLPGTFSGISTRLTLTLCPFSSLGLRLEVWPSLWRLPWPFPSTHCFLYLLYLFP